MSVLLDPEETETRVIHALVDFTNADVLDVGCGDGRLTWRFAERAHSVLGIDPLAASIEKARASVPARLRARVTFQVADVTTAELPQSAFDRVVLSWSLC
ncbi:MAG TPA: class I SAM-dependent methyltransferase [Ktedonobacterales bacterium]|nr:class I SAM-dependent methyltransferase [Ktedonobacterales bacterium]